jgi:signal recognition particle subunit SRP54
VQLDDHELVRIRAIIQSCTRKERENPDLLTRQPNRVRRIAKGSGQDLEKVQAVLQQFNMMRGMMQQFSNMGGGFLGNLPGFKQLNTMRQMKDMDIGALFGDLLGGGGEGGPFPGLPGMGGANLPAGYTLPGTRQAASARGTRSRSMSHDKKKRKRKAAKKARRKKGKK